METTFCVCSTAGCWSASTPPEAPTGVGGCAQSGTRRNPGQQKYWTTPILSVPGVNHILVARKPRWWGRACYRADWARPTANVTGDSTTLLFFVGPVCTKIKFRIPLRIPELSGSYQPVPRRASDPSEKRCIRGRERPYVCAAGQPPHSPVFLDLYFIQSISSVTFVHCSFPFISTAITAVPSVALACKSPTKKLKRLGPSIGVPITKGRGCAGVQQLHVREPFGWFLMGFTFHFPCVPAGFCSVWPHF